MNKIDLTCLMFPDLSQWERSAVTTMIVHLSKTKHIRQIDVTDRSDLNWKSLKASRAIWAISHNWKKTLGLLKRLNRQKIYLSVFRLGSIQQSLPTLFIRKFHPLISDSVHILVHSKLNYRFFQEIERFLLQ